MKRLTWVVLVHLFILFTMYHVFVKHEIKTDFYYTDGSYEVEYPCVIMEAPHVRYILHSSGGKITAEYKEAQYE